MLGPHLNPRATLASTRTDYRGRGICTPPARSVCLWSWLQDPADGNRQPRPVGTESASTATQATPAGQVEAATRPQEPLTAYTDGACSPNPGVNACAYQVEWPDGTIKARAAAEPQTTNNREELKAVREALLAIRSRIADPRSCPPGGCECDTRAPPHAVPTTQP